MLVNLATYYCKYPEKCQVPYWLEEDWNLTLLAEVAVC